MQYSSTNAVPQELVVLAIVALLNPRPVLLREDSRVMLVEKQLRSVVESLSDEPVIVSCNPSMKWEDISNLIKLAMGKYLVLLRVNQLSRDVELKMGYALVQPDPILREFLRDSAMIFTITDSLDYMNPFLRRHVLYKQDTSAIDVDSVLVEPPRNSAVAKNKARTVSELTKAMYEVEIVPELMRYMQDIIIYARTHRFAACGLRPQASADFEVIVRTLCALRGHSIATPMTIKDAARLTLPVHLKLVAAEDEPSLQYGGDPNLVKNWIKEWDAEVLIDFVLKQVPVPR